MESVEQTFSGSPDFGKRITATVARNGDLISRVYLQVTLPEVVCPSSASICFRWVNYIGHVLIRSVTVEIGGQQIDKQYGDWLTIWNELTQKPGLQVGYDNMVGNTVALTGTGLSRTEATTLYIPLQFWFCRNPGLALPLIALQYHEVRFTFELRQKSECYVACIPNDPANNFNNTNSCGIDVVGNSCDQLFCVPSLQSATLFIDYIYLDTDERRRFAQSSHEYLIEQLQFTGDESTVNTNVKVKLNFNHPVKELIWVVQRDIVTLPNYNQWTNYTDDIDLDLVWSPYGDPNDISCRNRLYTNVEAGHMAQSFPYVQTAPLGSFGGFNTLTRTTSEIEALLSPGVNFPAGFGPGPLANADAPVDFAANEDAAGGADHAGLAPRNAGRNPTVRAKLQLNGHDRFQERLGSYFNLVQPYQHHTNVPATGINVYSFALEPEKHQPSGTCNFSRIDSAVLQLQLTRKSTLDGGSKIRVYATNYNVLRIMSGMGQDSAQKSIENLVFQLYQIINSCVLNVCLAALISQMSNNLMLVSTCA
jgi:hypothetical protein